MINLLYYITAASVIYHFAVRLRGRHSQDSSYMPGDESSMMSTDRGQARALLVGIDKYSARGMCIDDLSGCATDVELMETYMRESVGVSNIRKLTSTSSSPGALPTVADLPTLKNVVAELQKLASEAQENDFVYVHFSGHGSRLPTLFPNLKLSNQDECLMLVREFDNKPDGPVDYLRDVELAYLLQQITDKGAIVTIVLDCCHSGGATRSQGTSVFRGIDNLRKHALVEREPICDLSVLKKLQPSNSGYRGASVLSHWSTMLEGVKFLAACRADQRAEEIGIDGSTKRRGLLTECLHDVLRQPHPEQLTCDMVYNLVSWKVTNHIMRKEPQDVVYEGERNRFFFGASRGKPTEAIVKSVTHLSNGKYELELSVGRAHGVVKANTNNQEGVYEIYLSGQHLDTAMDYTSRLAVCEIFQVGDFVSKARIREGEVHHNTKYKAIRQSEILERCIRNPKPAQIPQDIPSLDVTKLTPERALVILTNSVPPFFKISSHSPGDFTITFTFENKETTVNVKSEAALASHLMHIGLYDNILNLPNLAVSPGHSNQLEVEKIGYLPQGTRPPPPCLYNPNSSSQVFNLEVLEDCGSYPQKIRENDSICIRARNKNHKAMFIEILNLDPLWEATKIYPIGDNTYIEVPPGGAYDFFITMSKSESQTSHARLLDVDAIIVLATTNQQGNFPVNILPQLSLPFNQQSSPLRVAGKSRGAKGVDFDSWFARRVDVRVV